MLVKVFIDNDYKCGACALWSRDNPTSYFGSHLFCSLFRVSGRERRPVKSLVVGRPILLALEDIDGSPSFLEKALCFIEQYGTHWRYNFFSLTLSLNNFNTRSLLNENIRCES